MIGIFLKELRENAKWAAVIFAVLTVLVYDEIRRSDPFLMFHLARRLTVFFAPVAGLVMGVVQSLFETRPDNWAFVVHRPLSRRRVFAAKCAAGLVLLYVALELPCLLAAAWAAGPGNLAMPFQARMLLPTLADTLNAGCFYFAGMVLTLRRARWFGTRLLPVGLPLAGTAFAVLLLPEFWQALLLITAVQCIGGAAAWGAFATAGAMDRPGPSRLALAVMIYPGALAVGLFVTGLSQLFSPVETNRWYTHQMDSAGNILRVVRTRRTDNQRSSSVTDLEGQALPEYDGIDVDDRAHAGRFVGFHSILADDRVIPWPISTLYFDRGYRSASPGVVRLSSAGSGLACFFNAQRGTVDVYDPLSRLRRGTLGPAGFTSASSPSGQPFPANLLNAHQQEKTRTLAFPSVVYWVDLHQRIVQPLFTASEDDPVFSAVELAWAGKPAVLVATRRKLHLVRIPGSSSSAAPTAAPSAPVVFSIPLPHDPHDQYLQAAVLPAKQHLAVFVASAPGIAPFRSEYLEFAGDGKLVRRTVPPPLPLDDNSGKRRQTAIFGSFYPLVAMSLVPAWIVDHLFDFGCQRHASLLQRIVFGSAVFIVVGTILIGRRCGFGSVKTLVWSVANLLVGPAGIVALLGLSEWPVRERCVFCGGKRFVDRRECLRCGRQPPAPSFDGREIFEPIDSLHPCAG